MCDSKSDSFVKKKKKKSWETIEDDEYKWYLISEI